REHPNPTNLQFIPHVRSNAQNVKPQSGAMVARQGATAHPRRRKRVLELVCPYGAGKQRGRDGEVVGTYALPQELGAVRLRRKARGMVGMGTGGRGPDGIDGSLGRD